jgi:hypothetical protein
MNDWIKIPRMAPYQDYLPFYVRFGQMTSLYPNGDKECRLRYVDCGSEILIPMGVEQFIEYTTKELLKNNITANVTRLIDE